MPSVRGKRPGGGRAFATEQNLPVHSITTVTPSSAIGTSAGLAICRNLTLVPSKSIMSPSVLILPERKRPWCVSYSVM